MPTFFTLSSGPTDIDSWSSRVASFRAADLIAVRSNRTAEELVAAVAAAAIAAVAIGGLPAVFQSGNPDLFADALYESNLASIKAVATTSQAEGSVRCTTEPGCID